MNTFVGALILLVLGYIVYGAIVEKVFGADASRKTPCYTMQDGVDYIPMPTWKVYLIQFLNIAGTGPIFGAILGILYGPSAYLWIVFGCIFGGAVHDYFSGMISLRKNGASLPEIVGDELGPVVRLVMRIFSLVLMVLVGTVFVTTPAGLLATMTHGAGLVGSPLFWSIIIFIYYILATLLPIDALIGRIYPLFGVALLFMAVGVMFGIFTHDGFMPEVTSAWVNHNPNQSLSIFPMLFITIACGAISGFHATQSPMMARCMKNEKLGRRVFYGSMITEGIVALIWAAAAIKYAGSYERLAELMTAGGNMNPAIIVNAICNDWLGSVGAILAILGVVAAPVTSGDTAFRCARLIAADFLRYKQGTLVRRLIISLPLFLIAAVLMNINFDILWRYFAWFNQTLSIFTLWAVTVWLARKGKMFYLTLFPAMFMTCVCTSYILVAPEGFSLPYQYGVVAG
ncbi:MAG TPA: carbon starvation protein A, partial [Candidatus Paraprevotella stercorigallinarum]|nr:carbon starvation protein A [Candidatus Paraprevotella stercorigallinarum]